MCIKSQPYRTLLFALPYEGLKDHFLLKNFEPKLISEVINLTQLTKLLDFILKSISLANI